MQEQNRLREQACLKFDSLRSNNVDSCGKLVATTKGSFQSAKRRPRTTSCDVCEKSGHAGELPCPKSVKRALYSDKIQKPHILKPMKSTEKKGSSEVDRAESAQTSCLNLKKRRSNFSLLQQDCIIPGNNSDKTRKGKRKIERVENSLRRNQPKDSVAESNDVFVTHDRRAREATTLRERDDAKNEGTYGISGNSCSETASSPSFPRRSSCGANTVSTCGPNKSLSSFEPDVSAGAIRNELNELQTNRGTSKSGDSSRSRAPGLFSSLKFSDMADVLLHSRLVRTLNHHHLEHPTLIQQLSIPTVLHGHDVLIQCFTGSGKTLCFAVPLLQQLLQQHESSGKQLKRSDGTRCVLLMPTRELAAQVCEQISKLAQLFPWIVVASITGGEKKKSEKRRLRAGVSVLLCTPGRLLDHLDTTASFQVPFLDLFVLDEADRLLDLGFESKIRRIFKLLGERKEEQRSMRFAYSEILKEEAAQGRDLEQYDGKDFNFNLGNNEEATTRKSGCSHIHTSKRNSSKISASMRSGSGDQEEWDISKCTSHVGSHETTSHMRQHGGKRFTNGIENDSKNEEGDCEELSLCKRRKVPEKGGFQVVMVSATLTVQVQRLASFCLSTQPQWVSVERYVLPAQSASSSDSSTKEQQRSKLSSAFACCCTRERHPLHSYTEIKDSATAATPDSASAATVAAAAAAVSENPKNWISAGDSVEVSKEASEAAAEQAIYNVPEQLQQHCVVVQPRTRLLALLSFLLQLEKAKGKVLIFLSCCDAVEYMHRLCAQLRWPPPLAHHRKRDQNQLLLLQSAQQLQRRHGNKLQRMVARIGRRKRLQAKRVKQLKRDSGGSSSDELDTKLRIGRAGGIKSQSDDSGGEDAEADEVSGESEDEEDQYNSMWGEHVFKHLALYKLHGQMNRDDRIGYLKEFTESDSAAAIFATDVAARGLNLPHVNWVVQFDLPQQVEEYIHRIGRTARLGNEGNALLFLLDCEAAYATYLQQRGLHLKLVGEKQMIDTLCDVHMPEYLRHIGSHSTFLVKQFANYVSGCFSLLHLARKAFLGSLRSLRALNKTVKQVCDHASLHSGHYAASFCLSETPRATAASLRSGYSIETQRRADAKPASSSRFTTTGHLSFMKSSSSRSGNTKNSINRRGRHDFDSPVKRSKPTNTRHKGINSTFTKEKYDTIEEVSCSKSTDPPATSTGMDSVAAAAALLRNKGQLLLSVHGRSKESSLKERNGKLKLHMRKGADSSRLKLLSDTQRQQHRGERAGKRNRGTKEKKVGSIHATGKFLVRATSKQGKRTNISQGGWRNGSTVEEFMA